MNCSDFMSALQLPLHEHEHDHDEYEENGEHEGNELPFASTDAKVLRFVTSQIDFKTDLKEINLGGEKIGDEGVKFLFNTLQKNNNSTLKELWLHG
jgi:hypothetical protein